MESKVYDIVIIGSGLGGLECGAILSKEGYSVCILEQHSIYGGCLQSFYRDGRCIDTGIHYIGSMGEGQIMNQYLKFLGIYNNLNTKPLDSSFDIYSFGKDDLFCCKEGFINFEESLISRFSSEANGISEYCKKVREIGSTINVDVHKSGKLSTGSVEYFALSANSFINSCVNDNKLRSILSAGNMLYGADMNSANLYHHAMITNSNIEGAHRVIGGTQQIADLLIKEIIDNGGAVFNNSKVVSINVDGADVKSVDLENSERVFAKHFISNIHPATTFNMLGATPVIKKAYKTRLNLLENTRGLFTVYLLLKENSLKYINSNRYIFKDYNVWDSTICNSNHIPNSAFLSMQPSSSNCAYADVASIIAPVDFSLFDRWNHTDLMSRDSEYRELKSEITNKIIEYTASYYPNLKESIYKVYAASPLTFQHYTGTPGGSAYGVAKCYKSALTTLFSTKTKLNNLYLTGQNINVHGAIGVTLTAASTCANLLGEEYLAKKIGGV